jgi:hypothetical protein
MINKDTFCVAPWVAVEIDTNGSLKPCCAYEAGKNDSMSSEFFVDNYTNWRKEKLQPLRNDLLNGVKHPQCRTCWTHEESGNSYSFRNVMNQKFLTEDFDVSKLENPKFVTLLFGNFCNLKCLQCGPFASSSHEVEQKVHWDKFKNLRYMSNWVGPHSGNRKWYLTQEFSDLKTQLTTDAEEIFLVGGEPLITPEAIEFLDTVAHPENITLSIITNASVLTSKVFDILSKFKLITMTVSLDGIGEHAEYVRHGCVWSDVDANIKKILTLPNIATANDGRPGIGIAHTFQHTSYKTLIPILEYAVEMQLHDVRIEKLLKPSHLSIDSLLPDDHAMFVSRLTELLNNQKFSSHHKDINFALTVLKDYQFDAELHKDFVEHVALLDNIRKTSYDVSIKNSHGV